MAKNKKVDDLSAIRKSMVRPSTPKDLDAINKIAKSMESPSEKPSSEEQINKEKKSYHRTTISLPVPTYKKAKKHCVDIGKTLTEYITDLIENDIKP